jgi:4-aminobutyrate aminotransferase-like enzyme
LTERLGGLTPPGLDSFFFASAGTEAIEAALRLARQATGRPNVVVFHGSFHGRTVGSLSMTTSRVGLRAGLQPLMGGVVVSPFPDAFRYGWDVDTAVRFCLAELDFIFETLSAPRETAAMFLEPVLGEGGYVPVPPAFAAGLRERCDRHGILLVIDEIQTGVGRTGRFWGHEHLGITPDVLVTAKGLASGLPLSAFAASEDLMSQGWPGSQGGTYGGNAVACAAALATLDVVEDEGLVGRAAELGPYLTAGLQQVATDHPDIADVRGRGLMIGTVFTGNDGEPAPDAARRVQVEAERAGLLLLTCGSHGNVVRWIPPLIVTSEQIDEALEMFALALQKADVR